ncbi:MAG: hypothetical protein M3441_23810, partial [Chloroflexota bacterium]|nr:hypothetical protein [Chloroflexota bacterium]
WVQSRVVRPLGEEATAVLSAGHVFTRHRKVAAAILVEADQVLGVDAAEVWMALVRQTIRTSRDVPVGYQSHPKIVHAGPRLQSGLPKQLPEQRRKEIAVAASKAAITTEPERLDFITDLGRTYRFAENFAAAVQVFRANLAHARRKADYANSIRGYWYEWGICEGLIGDTIEHRVIGAWLQGLSLSDHLNPAPITKKKAGLSFAGIGVAFGKLAERRPDCPYAKARRAIAHLGRLIPDDPKGTIYYDRYDREADKIKTPLPKDLTEAIAWLTAGVSQAGAEIKDPFFSNFTDSSHVTFMRLRTILVSAPTQQRSRKKKRSRRYRRKNQGRSTPFG